MLPQIELVDKGHAAGEAGLGVVRVDVLVELLKVGYLLAALLAHRVVFVFGGGGWSGRRRQQHRAGRFALLFRPATFSNKRRV
jgi:hypothetical protein